MQTSVIPGSGEISRVFLMAPVEYMLITVSPKGNTNNAAILLVYSEELLPPVLKIVSEMQKRNVSPKVYLKHGSGSTDIVVLFQVNVDYDFLRSYLDASQIIQVDEKNAQMITTAEAEIKKDAAMTFLSGYRNDGFFWLFFGEIVNGEWQSAKDFKLTPLHEGRLPNLDDLSE